jgi:60 kDa SS-A/Ro ribonucleoprotein
MKTNVKVKQPAVFTHEGAPAARIDAEAQLRRSVMACMLWEDGFYESGQSIGDRIRVLIPQVRPDFAAACAFHARTAMKLRHVPLLIVREMARLPEHKKLVSKLLCDVIQRPDEITEFLSLYWQSNEGKRTLSAQIKKALAKAFLKFDEYALAKYNRDGAVKLRDALFLSHANPCAKGAIRYTKVERKEGVSRNLNERETLFQKLVTSSLETPDTWEVALSGGADKREAFERLMAEKKLGALAFIRNLRNMAQVGIEKQTVTAYTDGLKVERVLPFRFITAARIVPQWEDVIEPLMMKCLAGQEKLSGKTVLLVDVSGSMDYQLSGKSDTTRMDAAMGLAVLIREVCEQSEIFTFSQQVVHVAPRHGFALRDAIKNSQPHGGTFLKYALDSLHGKATTGMLQAQTVWGSFTPVSVNVPAHKTDYDRIIVITDEQSHDGIANPQGKGYVVNVASNQNGVGYGAWTHIDGWSEAVIDYIREFERNPESVTESLAA